MAQRLPSWTIQRVNESQPTPGRRRQRILWSVSSERKDRAEHCSNTILRFVLATKPKPYKTAGLKASATHYRDSTGVNCCISARPVLIGQLWSRHFPRTLLHFHRHFTAGFDVLPVVRRVSVPSCMA